MIRGWSWLAGWRAGLPARCLEILPGKLAGALAVRRAAWKLMVGPGWLAGALASRHAVWKFALAAWLNR